MALGGITVPAYGELKDALAQHMPNIKLGGMGYFNPGYLTQGVGDVGMFTSPASVTPNVSLCSPAVQGVPARR